MSWDDLLPAAEIVRVLAAEADVLVFRATSPINRATSPNRPAIEVVTDRPVDVASVAGKKTVETFEAPNAHPSVYVTIELPCARQSVNLTRVYSRLRRRRRHGGCRRSCACSWTSAHSDYSLG